MASTQERLQAYREHAAFEEERRLRRLEQERLEAARKEALSVAREEAAAFRKRLAAARAERQKALAREAEAEQELKTSLWRAGQLRAEEARRQRREEERRLREKEWKEQRAARRYQAIRASFDSSFHGQGFKSSAAAEQEEHERRERAARVREWERALLAERAQRRATVPVSLPLPLLSERDTVKHRTLKDDEVVSVSARQRQREASDTAVFPPLNTTRSLPPADRKHSRRPAPAIANATAAAPSDRIANGECDDNSGVEAAPPQAARPNASGGKPTADDGAKPRPRRRSPAFKRNYHSTQSHSHHRQVYVGGPRSLSWQPDASEEEECRAIRKPIYTGWREAAPSPSPASSVGELTSAEGSDKEGCKDGDGEAGQRERPAVLNKAENTFSEDLVSVSSFPRFGPAARPSRVAQVIGEVRKRYAP